MSNQNLGGIKPKRGLRPPTQAEIQEFELAYDANGNALYTKVGTSIVKIMGQSHYLHIRYAPNATPTSGQMFKDPQGDTTHMGVAISQSSDAPTAPGEYSWTKTMGAQGPQGLQGVAGESVHEIYIESSNALLFKGETYSTKLTARIMYGGTDITDLIQPNQLAWRRKSDAGTTADGNWTKSGKEINITQSDIVGVTTFYLDFEIM